MPKAMELYMNSPMRPRPNQKKAETKEQEEVKEQVKPQSGVPEQHEPETTAA